MTVCELKKGEEATVKEVSLPKDLKERLRALGIAEGATVRVLKIYFRRTFLVSSPESKAALSKEVAAGISVEAL